MPQHDQVKGKKISVQQCVLLHYIMYSKIRSVWNGVLENTSLLVVLTNIHINKVTVLSK